MVNVHSVQVVVAVVCNDDLEYVMLEVDFYLSLGPV